MKMIYSLMECVLSFAPRKVSLKVMKEKKLSALRFKEEEKT